MPNLYWRAAKRSGSAYLGLWLRSAVHEQVADASGWIGKMASNYDPSGNGIYCF